MKIHNMRKYTNKFLNPRGTMYCDRGMRNTLIQMTIRTMRLHEYQAASLMLKYHIPVPLVIHDTLTSIGSSSL